MPKKIFALITSILLAFGSMCAFAESDVLENALSPGSRVLVPPLLELVFEDGYIRFNAPNRLERVRLERLEQPPRAASGKEESK